MSAYGKVKKIVRAVLWLSMGLLLLVAGLAGGLDSPRVSTMRREASRLMDDSGPPIR